MPQGWSLETLLGTTIEKWERAQRETTRLYLGKALSAAQCDKLMTLADLERVLCTQPLVSPLVRVVNQGKRLPVEHFTVTSGSEPDAVRYVDTLRLYRSFRDGGSLVIRDLHRFWPPLTELSWDLSQELGCAVTVNAYLTPPHTQGFKAHFDYHDIIVIQLVGTKEWAEFDANAELPLDNNNWRHITNSVDPKLPGDHPSEIGSHLLSPGDVLFVPRGGSHAVRSHEEVTFHLTLELQQWTHFDVAVTLLQRVSHWRPLRESVPRGIPARRGLDRESIATAAQLLCEFGEQSAVEDIDWTLRRESHGDLFETPISLVSQLACARSFDRGTVAARRQHLLYTIRESDTAVVVELKDRTFRFPAQCSSAVREAMSGRPVSVASCAIGGLSPEHAGKLLQVLVSEAVLAPVHPDIPEE